MLSDVLILVAWQNSVHKFLQEVVKDAFNWEKTLNFLILSTQNVSQWFWTWSWQSLESSIIAHFELCTVIYCRTVLKNYVTRMGLILENTKAFNKLDLKRSSRVSQRKTFQTILWKQPEFSPNTGKYGPGKTPHLDTFHAAVFSGGVYARSQKNWWKWKKLRGLEKILNLKDLILFAWALSKITLLQ